MTIIHNNTTVFRIIQIPTSQVLHQAENLLSRRLLHDSGYRKLLAGWLVRHNKLMYRHQANVRTLDSDFGRRSKPMHSFQFYSL